MEGTQCSQPGCNCHDFLPFECLLCEEVYCLEHRSRFNHSCVIYAPEIIADEIYSNPKSPGMFQSIMDAVTNRFSTDPPTSTKEHHKIKSSAMPSEMKTDSKLAGKLGKLDDVASRTNSLKQKSICDKTRQILIKNKALGNSEVAAIDRHYLVIYFIPPPSIDANSNATMPNDRGEPSYFYFNRNISIAEMIHYLKKNYSPLVNTTYASLPANINRESLTLAIITNDSSNWKSWNRNALLKDTFLNFEEISLFPMDLNEVVSNQAKIQTTQRVITMSNPIRVKTKEDEEREARMKRDFVKGDFAWYHKASNKIVTTPVDATDNTTVDHTKAEDTESTVVTAETESTVNWAIEEMLLVVIIGVHHDDYPNIYYTIQPVKPVQFMNGKNNNTELEMHVFEEKQTDATHLRHLEKGDANGVDKLLDDKTRATLESNGEPVPIRLSHGDIQYQNVKIGNMCTIGQLRQLARIVTGVPIKDMKLICKGTVLKTDSQLIKSSKIVNGSKIIVMSSTAK